MPNPNDPALRQQKKDLNKQIEDLEAQIDQADEAGEDTTALDDRLEQLRAQRTDIDAQQRSARNEAKAARKS